MSFENRTGKNLNRRKLTIVSQTPTEIIADIERLDGPITNPGTPLTAENLELIQKVVDDANAINSSINALKERADSTDTSLTQAYDRLCDVEAAVYYDFKDRIFPRGSVYISAFENESPAELFGGEWVQLTDCFLLASSDLSLSSGSRKYNLYETGGEEKHLLTEEEMPMHTHLENFTSNEALGNLIGLRLSTMPWTSDIGNYDCSRLAGGDKAHNNMPPYFVVNVWYRLN